MIRFDPFVLILLAAAAALTGFLLLWLVRGRTRRVRRVDGDGGAGYSSDTAQHTDGASGSTAAAAGFAGAGGAFGGAGADGGWGGDGDGGGGGDGGGSGGD